MSRLEKARSKKYCKKRYKTICRFIFLIIMIITTTASVLLIDYRINNLLDDDSKDNLIQYVINIF